MSGMSSLFPEFPAHMSVKDRVNIIISRHKHNYFKDWTSDQLETSTADSLVKPIQPITSEVYNDRIKKNEVTRNKKLSYCVDIAAKEDAPNWAKKFYDDLCTNKISSTTKAKDLASSLWRQYSPEYDNKRAVQVPSSQPGHNVKRKRRENEAEYTYRKRLAAENAVSTNMNEIADDPAAETAMSIQPSLKYIMQLNKAQLQAKIADSSESVEILKQHGSMKTFEDKDC